MSLCELDTVHAQSALPGEVQARSYHVQAKLRALLCMLAWFAASGFATGYFGIQDLFDCIVNIAAAVAFAILAYRWCDADARLHNSAHWDQVVPALFLIPGPLVMVPLYLTMTRRLRSVRSIALAAVYLFVLCAVGVTSLLVGLLVSGRGSPSAVYGLI